MGSLAPRLPGAADFRRPRTKTVAVSRLEETVDALSTGIFLTEGQGRITYMNSAAKSCSRPKALKATNGRLAAAQPKARESRPRFCL